MPISDDVITTQPTIQDRHGRAWKLDMPALLSAAKVDPAKDSTVSSWIVEATWAHPLWHSYWLVLIHLRPTEGQQQPLKIYLEGATHELWLYALDSDKPRQEMIDTGRMRTLTPMNFGAQIIEDDDEAAAGRIRWAVMDICAGKLNPDTDFIRQWAQRFGDNMMLK